MSLDKIMEAYNRLAKKYKLILERLDKINEKLVQSKVNVNELREIISKALNEVILL